MSRFGNRNERNLEIKQGEILELRGELSKIQNIGKLTLDKLYYIEREIGKEKTISNDLKNQVADYLSKGMHFQTASAKTLVLKNSLFENQQSAPKLRNIPCERQEQLCAALKEYEMKHEDHEKKIQSKISQFASSAHEQNVLMKDFMDEVSKLIRELKQAKSKKGFYLPIGQYEELIGELESMKERNTKDKKKRKVLRSKNIKLSETLENYREENHELKS